MSTQGILSSTKFTQDDFSTLLFISDVCFILEYFIILLCSHTLSSYCNQTLSCRYSGQPYKLWYTVRYINELTNLNTSGQTPITIPLEIPLTINSKKPDWRLHKSWQNFDSTTRLYQTNTAHIWFFFFFAYQMLRIWTCLYHYHYIWDQFLTKYLSKIIYLSFLCSLMTWNSV